MNEKFPFKLKVYMITIWITTIILWPIATILYKNEISSIKLEELVIWTILFAVGESVGVLYGKKLLTTSFAILLASFVIIGPYGCCIATVGYLFKICIIKDGNKVYKDHIFSTPIYGTITNLAMIMTQTLIIAIVIKILGEILGNNIKDNYILSIALFTVLSFAINILFIGVLESIISGCRLLRAILENLKLTLLNSLAMVPLGIILMGVFEKDNYWGMLIVLSVIVYSKCMLQLYINSKNQYTQTVEAFMNALEARDNYTEGHSRRVSEISTEIAKNLGYNYSQTEKLKIAALMHDIGKIGISDTILNKPGNLTDEEFKIIKKHPEISFGIISKINDLQYASDIALYHHERYDGKGYPSGKKGEELDIDVYIVQLADSVDAMTTDRPYRKAMSMEYVKDELRKNSGTQFHPKVVEAYLKILEKKEG